MNNPSQRNRSVPTRIAAVAGVAFGALALGALAQTTTWTAPSATPPGNNVAAPLNVGTSNQTKTGGSIQINGGFGIAGGPFIYLPTGVTPTAGQALVADATTPGKVVWGSVAGGGGGCIQSQNFSLFMNTGNNTAYLKVLGLLQPGTYVFSGNGQSTNSGGGGIDSVFLSSTLYTTGNISTYPSEVSSYVGTTGQTVSQALYYGSGNPLIYAIKRNGSNDSSWSVPSGTMVTLTQAKYVYFILNQAGESGFINVTGSPSSCASSGYTAPISSPVDVGIAAPSYWWNSGTGSNIGTTSCPVGYYMSGVVQTGGCSGGYCGLNVVCSHF